jgi:hypothetical protein
MRGGWVVKRNGWGGIARFYWANCVYFC